jgi:hypothetical protein
MANVVTNAHLRTTAQKETTIFGLDIAFIREQKAEIQTLTVILLLLMKTVHFTNLSLSLFHLSLTLLFL